MSTDSRFFDKNYYLYAPDEDFLDIDDTKEEEEEDLDLD